MWLNAANNAGMMNWIQKRILKSLCLRKTAMLTPLHPLIKGIKYLIAATEKEQKNQTKKSIVPLFFSKQSYIS